MPDEENGNEGVKSIATFETTADSSAVFRRDNDLFKRKNGSWEFFFRNDESIQDIQPLRFYTHEGLFVISNGKVTRWTNYVPSKRIYLKVRDRAGNESDISNACATISLDLAAIKGFIPSGRILDVDEYGVITYSYDSIDGKLFYGGDLLDTEIGIYESEVFNGSNNLVAWRTITWESTEPVGTSISIQIRSGESEDDVADADWSEDLIRNESGYVNIEFVQYQFIQYRAILRSTVRDISPTLHNVTIRNLSSAATHFFTTNFVLPNRVVSGILTENSTIPVSADIVFGINTKNSVDFVDYQIIEPNRIFTTDSKQFGENLRVGVKLISPGITHPTSQDPYEETSHLCQIGFDFTNTDASTKTFQFRVSFYSDVNRTQLAYEFFSGNNQTGWSYSNDIDFPATGISIAPNSDRSIVFEPGQNVPNGVIYYLKIEAYSDAAFEDVKLHDSYVCGIFDPYDEYAVVSVPALKNLSIIFSLEEAGTVKLNI